LSILTKIAIVVMVVLSLLITVVLVNMATVQPNWKQAYLQETKKSKQAQATARNQAIALDKWIQAQQAETLAMQAETLSKQEKIDALQSQLNEKQQAIASLKATEDEIRGENINLSAAIKSAHELRDQIAGKLDTALTDKEDLATKLTNIQEQLASKETQVERLTQLNKIRLERIAEMEDRIAALNEEITDLRRGTGGVAAADGAAAAAGVTGEKVLGEITAMEDGVASVNIGQAKGVTKGMRLIIYRGGDFVGYLDVSNVSTTQAAGLITYQELDPKVGDNVTNKLAR
jgi:myosin heavy subunit